MKRFVFGLVAAVVTLGIGTAYAEFVFEYQDGKECRVGGDIRIRLTHWDRNVVSPDWDALGLEPGPAVEYLRVRERVYGCFEINDKTDLQLRLINRWHHYSSYYKDPNNQDSPGGSTWNFPDEVVFDNLFLDMREIMDSNWSVRIGRQDIALGNGMVMLEGTPYDQGRSIYFDGIVAKYQTESDTLSLLGLYNRYKDTFAFINDENRRLRRGDTLILGAYWTHSLSQKVNTDLYYIYANIDDDRDGAAEPVERYHVADENAELQIVGARVFGDVSPQVNYSVEAAQEFGQYGPATINRGADFSGKMVDARLGLKAADGTPFDPELALEYTYLSGDDQGSTEEIEGWHPAFAEYPIWREELLPITFNGNWTNLNQYRAQLKLTLVPERVTLTGAYAVLIADEGKNNMINSLGDNSGGDRIGDLTSAFLDIKVLDNLDVAFEAAFFDPGNNWQEAESSEWLRMQTVYKF